MLQARTKRLVKTLPIARKAARRIDLRAYRDGDRWKLMNREGDLIAAGLTTEDVVTYCESLMPQPQSKKNPRRHPYGRAGP